MGRYKLGMKKLELLLQYNTQMGIAANPEVGGFSIFMKKEEYQRETLVEAIEAVPEEFTRKPRCKSTHEHDHGTHRGGFQTLQCEGAPKHKGKHVCWVGSHTECWD